MAEVAVIVVSWNTRDELLACAASVFAARDVDLELWVVDNGSSDDSVATLRAAPPHTHILAAGENLGFAEGVSRGLAASASPWVLLLDSDAVLDDGDTIGRRCGTMGDMLDVTPRIHAGSGPA